MYNGPAFFFLDITGIDAIFLALPRPLGEKPKTSAIEAAGFNHPMQAYRRPRNDHVGTEILLICIASSRTAL